MADQQQLLDTASIVVTSKAPQLVTYTSSGVGIVSALAKIDTVALLFLAIAFCSLICTVVSLLIRWRYKYKTDQREQELHCLEVQKKKAELNEYKR
ncbi:hypothetical protein I2F27_06380 [Acinetobacter sp. B5B]|uniref:hypothetical protein n=1 Tax=Acinetobacter TaxID=469 RepID=UPI0018A33173|nr:MULTISPECIES: hypothetical protein [Acinetobacter]MBF7682953.1 hypothetical protein [Acinetobacter baretiae]MBF7696224.1 hypothetical protein [Acinetobacter rathckeae]